MGKAIKDLSPEELKELLKQKEEELEGNINALLEQSKKDESKYQLTELGNAKRYADKFGKEFKYIIEEKQWVKWNGDRWARDKDGHTYRNIDEILEQIKEEIKPKEELLVNLYEASKSNPEDDRLKAAIKRVYKQIYDIEKWYKASQTHKRIEDMLVGTSKQEGMSREICEMDSKGHYLGVKNGVLDLRKEKFKLVSGNPEYFMMNSCNVKYDPDADCPEWRSFLTKILKEDEELVQFIQRLVGQGLLGLSDKDKLTMFYGTGANGKSTLVGTINDILGDYGSVMNPKIIMEGKQNEEYYLADLKGVRTLFMSEAERGVHVASGVVKSLLGGEEITARFPHGRVFKFLPVLTPILSTNHKPRITDMDHGLWRRLLLVPFEYKINDDEKVEGFKEKILMPEANGILNWCIEGCLMYQSEGLNPPQSVLKATDEYKVYQDKLGMFIGEKLEEDLSEKLRTKDVHEIYKLWCEENGFKYGNVMTLANDLRERGCEVRTSTGNVSYLFGWKRKELKGKSSEPGSDNVRELFRKKENKG